MQFPKHFYTLSVKVSIYGNNWGPINVISNLAVDVSSLSRPSSPLQNSFFISSLEIRFLWTTWAMLPVFLRSFTNILILYLPK